MVIEHFAKDWIIQGYGYWLSQRKRTWDWGWVIEGQHSNQTTQQLTQTEPEFQYSWFPAAAPLYSFATAILAKAILWKSNRVLWNLQMTLPLASGQIREWETQRVNDWGTSPIKLQTDWQIEFHSWSWQLGAQAQSIPWNHMKYWNQDSYLTATLNSSIKKTF